MYSISARLSSSLRGRLLAEIAGAEVVAAIDDEVRALADGQQRIDQIGEDFLRLFIARALGQALEIVLHLQQQVHNFFLMLQLVFDAGASRPADRGSPAGRPAFPRGSAQSQYRHRRTSQGKSAARNSAAVSADRAGSRRERADSWSAVVRSIVPGTLSPSTESLSRFSGQSIFSMESWKESMRAATDGLGIEFSHAVVQQERRRRPDADQRSRTRVAACRLPASGSCCGSPGYRVIPGDRAHRGKIFVGLRGEVVPDIVRRWHWSPAGCRRWSAAASRARACRWKDSCPSRKSGLLNDGPHLGLEVVGLGPCPILVPAVQIVFARAAMPGSIPGAPAGILLEWQRAQRSAKTILPRSSLASSLVR